MSAHEKDSKIFETVRNIVAQQLGVDKQLVTLEANFANNRIPKTHFQGSSK